MGFLDAPPLPFYFSADHEQFRASVRDFVAREIAPHVTAWDEAGDLPALAVPRGRRARPAGPRLPGGIRRHAGRRCCAAGRRRGVARARQRRRAGEPVLARTSACRRSSPRGSEALKRRVVPPVLAGEKIAALAITEPGGGSDVARLRPPRTPRRRRTGSSTARRPSSPRACAPTGITVAVRTERPGRRRHLAARCRRATRPASRARRSTKMGWWCSDTAHLRFDGCRVPADQPDRRGERAAFASSWTTSTASGC